VAVPPPLLDDDDAALFPKLTDAQVQMLSSHGEVRSFEAGEVLWGPRFYRRVGGTRP
jgi:hypothetical protein